jgi:hypothetical protein
MMMQQSTRFVVVVLSLAATAAGAQATRDSAGIRIIENAKPVWTSGREWRLSEKPIVTIGGGSGPDSLARIVGVTRLSDGRIVVAEQTTLQLRFYDKAGRHLKSVGGKGESEEQFRYMSSMTRLAADSVAVDMPRMASIFAPNGVFVRRVEFGPFAPGTLQTPFVAALARFGNGHAVVADYPQGKRRPAGAQRWVDSASLFLTDAKGAVVRPLGNAAVVILVAGTTNPSPVDFGPQAVYASNGRSIYWGFPSEYDIRVYDANWKLERIIRRAWTPRALSRDEIDAYVDGWMKMWSRKSGAEREAERAEMRGNYYPEYLPAYSAFVATSTGEILVREPDLTGAPGCWCLNGIPSVPSRWSVFDATGRWLGDMSMPPRFVPLEVGADYVLGRSRDADNVPRAVMYRLEKPR